MIQTKAELPEAASIGDIYQVIEDSTMYIWDGFLGKYGVINSLNLPAWAAE